MPAFSHCFLKRLMAASKDSPSFILIPGTKKTSEKGLVTMKRGYYASEALSQPCSFIRVFSYLDAYSRSFMISLLCSGVR